MWVACWGIPLSSLLKKETAQCFPSKCLWKIILSVQQFLKMNLHQVQNVGGQFSFCSNFSQTNNSLETGLSIYPGRELRRNSPRPHIGKPLQDWQQPCAQCCVPTEMPNQGFGMRTTGRPDASHPSLASGNEERSGSFSLYSKPSLLCHLAFGRALGEQ